MMMGENFRKNQFNPLFSMIEREMVRLGMSLIEQIFLYTNILFSGNLVAGSSKRNRVGLLEGDLML